MTNFEKWKEGLKTENAYNLIDSMCGSCPAKQYCIDNPNMSKCEDAFYSWANSQAEEETIEENCK